MEGRSENKNLFNPPILFYELMKKFILNLEHDVNEYSSFRHSGIRTINHSLDLLKDSFKSLEHTLSQTKKPSINPQEFSDYEASKANLAEMQRKKTIYARDSKIQIKKLEEEKNQLQEELNALEKTNIILISKISDLINHENEEQDQLNKIEANQSSISCIGNLCGKNQRKNIETIKRNLEKINTEIKFHEETIDYIHYEKEKNLLVRKISENNRHKLNVEANTSAYLEAMEKMVSSQEKYFFRIAASFQKKQHLINSGIPNELMFDFLKTYYLYNELYKKMNELTIKYGEDDPEERKIYQTFFETHMMSDQEKLSGYFEMLWCPNSNDKKATDFLEKIPKLSNEEKKAFLSSESGEPDQDVINGLIPIEPGKEMDRITKKSFIKSMAPYTPVPETSPLFSPKESISNKISFA